MILNRRLLVGAAFLSPLILIGLIAYRGSHRNNATSSFGGSGNPAFTEQQLGLFTKWASLPFLPIEDTQGFRLELRKIKLNSISEISQTQREEIYTSVANLLLANFSGTYEAFRNFRTPTEHFVFSETAKSFLEAELKRTSSVFSVNDKEQALRFYWDGYLKKYHEQFWTAVDIQGAEILVERKSAAEVDLEDLVKNKENIGMVRLGAGIKSVPLPSDILARTGGVTWAFVGFVTKNSDLPYPVWCSFYWDDGANKWIPAEMVGAYSGPRKRMFSF